METATTSRVPWRGDDQRGAGEQRGEERPLVRDAAQPRLRNLLGDPDRGVGDAVARVAELPVGGVARGVDALAGGVARGARRGRARRRAPRWSRRARRRAGPAVACLVGGHRPQDSLGHMKLRGQCGARHRRLERDRRRARPRRGRRAGAELILVARGREKLETLAAELRAARHARSTCARPTWPTSRRWRRWRRS